MRRVVLPITPKGYVNSIPSDTLLFNIPSRCRYIPSEKRYLRKDEEVDIRILGCELYNNTGFCRHTSSKFVRQRLRRLIGYNDYKKAVKRLCQEYGVTLQYAGWSIYFYFPMPGRWSKRKRARMAGQLKMSKPDTDNLCKGFFDSIGKRRGDGSQLIPDERMAQLSGTGKFWLPDSEVMDGLGYIEILFEQPLYNPFNVTFTYEFETYVKK